ncbi:DinB family protein [Variovorax sp. R-27]|uniref:DinB family protein n=1 Tax=Variovorax sp. R-27 TaxID=3404058 RepID=UPI003CEB9143
MNPTTLSALAAFPSQLEAHYAAIPNAYRHWAPPSWEGVPSEAFTAIEQLCHVRDIEIEGYHVRFRRTLQETHPTLASIDSEPLAIERAYGTADAAKVLAEFRMARVQTMEIISSLSDAQLARTAVFEGYGPLTMRSLVHYLCSHDQQHLAGLQWLAGKIDASTVDQ